MTREMQIRTIEVDGTAHRVYVEWHTARPAAMSDISGWIASTASALITGNTRYATPDEAFAAAESSIRRHAARVAAQAEHQVVQAAEKVVQAATYTVPTPAVAPVQHASARQVQYAWSLVCGAIRYGTSEADLPTYEALTRMSRPQISETITRLREEY